MAVSDKHQVVPGDVTAFGVSVSSRHGLAWELAELLQFAQALAERDVEQYVVSAFYDSNANCCAIELSAPVRETDPVGLLVHQAARATLSQFDWAGTVDHGEPTLRAAENAQ